MKAILLFLLCACLSTTAFTQQAISDKQVRDSLVNKLTQQMLYVDLLRSEATDKSAALEALQQKIKVATGQVKKAPKPAADSLRKQIALLKSELKVSTMKFDSCLILLDSSLAPTDSCRVALDRINKKIKETEEGH